MPDLKSEFNRAVQRLNKAWDALHSEQPPQDDRTKLAGQLAELEHHDPGTRIHVEKVALYSYKLVLALGYDKDIAVFMRNAIKLHDTGKNNMPSELLYNARQLKPEEFEQIKMHTIDGAHMLLDASSGSLGVLAAEIALYHHERLDGSGYHGLEGEDIPWYVRIASIADTFEAMTNETRSYQDALSPQEAIEKMQETQDAANGNFFDPEMFEAFKQIAEQIHAEAAQYIGEGITKKAKNITEIRSLIYGTRKPSNS